MMPYIPPRVDLFAILILLGIVQGCLLCFFFFSNSKGDQFPNRFQGGALLVITLVMTDVWLGYTNYMMKVLWLNDFTEPCNLCIGPFFYLYVRSGLRHRFHKREWLHFLPAILYFAYMCVMVYPQPISSKYHDFRSAFHPELPALDYKWYGEGWMFWPKRLIKEFTGASLLLYMVLSWREVILEFRRRGWKLWSAHEGRIAWYRDLLVHMTMIVGVFFTILLTFPRDLGDHIVVAHMAFVIYATSFTILRESRIFRHEPPAAETRKYEKSSLTPDIESRTLEKLRALFQEEKPYLDPLCSLPGLAARLHVSTHHLSQVLNDTLGQNFFEFLATYRIDEAKQLLADPAMDHVRIEEIAERVGYSSKSAFNGAFKRLSGQTPSAYRSASRSA